MGPRLNPGWLTDLAVLRLGGALIEEREDHLVVRSPDNPTYHWGNFVLVTDPTAVDDAERWTHAFATEFPDAGHVAVGLVREPAHDPWEAAGLEVEIEDVLETSAPPEIRGCPDGYLVRELTGDDWDQQVALAVRDNEESGAQDPATYPDYASRRTTDNRGLVERGVGAWFGAFHDGSLVADLGIVDCGFGTARYRSVGTRSDHRRRGLAGHLLGQAATWARDVRGCTRWVILTESAGTESIGPAGRLYRSLGFSPTTPNAQAYRAPRW